MKESVLIYSIFRNSESKVEQYYCQIKEIVNSFPDYDFYISIYENDSTDSTKEKLNSLDFSFAKDVSIVCENIGTPVFASIPAEERVKNLSIARNKAVTGKDFLSKVNYVMMIESDVRYPIDTVRKLLKFEEYSGLRADIVSAVLWSNEKKKHYDTWGTRQTDNDTWGKLYDNWDSTDYAKYYATCNGICRFNADAMRKGAMYHWFNKKLNTFDCDTVVVCENFHNLGYHEIYIVHTADCYHK